MQTAALSFGQQSVEGCVGSVGDWWAGKARGVAFERGRAPVCSASRLGRAMRGSPRRGASHTAAAAMDGRKGREQGA